MILYDYLLDVRGIGKGSAATRPMSRREEARGVGRANARGEGRETFSPIRRFSERSRRYTAGPATGCRNSPAKGRSNI